MSGSGSGLKYGGEDDLAVDLSGSLKGSSGLHHHAERAAGHHYPRQAKDKRPETAVVSSGRGGGGVGGGLSLVASEGLLVALGQGQAAGDRGGECWEAFWCFCVDGV